LGGERRESGAAARWPGRGNAPPATARSALPVCSLGGGRRCGGSGRNGLRRLRVGRGGSANGVLWAARLSGHCEPQPRREL